MNTPKLVCFDLDDTLIRDIHSVMLLCILNGKNDSHTEIQKQENEGLIDYIQADYLRAKLIAGLPEKEIYEHFPDIIKPLDNISFVTDTLHRNNILSIVITAGPKQVAKAAKRAWGLDDYYGSDYEVINGIFTGRIIRHMGGVGKIDCLRDYCKKHDIGSENCIAVGDGGTDIPLFQYCGSSIAINYSPAVLGKATNYIYTQDLADILRYIL